MAKRVVDTTARFIEKNLGTSKRGTEIMKDRDQATKFGRTSETSYKNCLALFGLCKQYIKKSLKDTYLKTRYHLHRWLFIYLQIQNNLREPCAELRASHNVQMVFKPKPHLLKFTSPVHRNSSGGWSQEGIDVYFQYYKREKKERKDMKNKYQGNTRENMCDYFHPVVETEDDNDSILGDGDKEAEIVDYEDEYSTNNSVTSSDADLCD
eukprot:scaffold13657_cov71-Attheya_sp.AAC.2